MKGFIKSLWERGRKVYPITRSRAVVCEDGKDLEERLVATERAQSGLSRALKSAKETFSVELFAVSLNAYSAQSAASAAEASVKALQEEVERLRSELEALQNNSTDYSALEARITTLESNVVTSYDDTELRERITDLESNVTSYDDTELRDMIATLDGNVSRLYILIDDVPNTYVSNDYFSSYQTILDNLPPTGCADRQEVVDTFNNLQEWTGILNGCLSNYNIITDPWSNPMQ